MDATFEHEQEYEDGMFVTADDVTRDLLDIMVPTANRSTPPRWGPTRFRPLIRAYAPCGPSVRVDELAKSRKYPRETFCRSSA